MGKIAKLNPKVLDLSLALEEFLLAKQTDGLASSSVAPIATQPGKSGE